MMLKRGKVGKWHIYLELINICLISIKRVAYSKSAVDYILTFGQKMDWLQESYNNIDII